MIKFIYKVAFVLFINAFFLFSLQKTFAQVSKYQSIEKVGKEGFNYVGNKLKKYKYKKDKSVKVVFSDRENNIAYLDPYGQQKGKSQKFLTPYFVIDSKNGFYELVVADSSLIGKPKGIFSFFMNKKYHFSDTKGLSYIGWVSQNSLVNYSTSITEITNNKPLKYKIGVSQIKSLFKLKKYFNKDSLSVYKDPSFRKKSNKVLLTNQTVYPYKYDLTKRAVFVSTKSVIKDTLSQVSGWIPSELIVPIGQNEVLKFNDDFYTQIITQKGDTINLHHQDLYSKYLYKNSFNQFDNKDSIVNVNAPLYVWDHSKNKLINVKGDDILVSEVDRFIKESKVVNFHFIFNEQEKRKIKPLINSLQSVWVTLSKYPNIKLSFSAICTGKKSFILPKTNSFAKWLDFMQQVSESGNNIQVEKKLNTTQAIAHTLSKEVYKNFENNFFIIVGSEEELDLHEQTRVIKELAISSSKVLFVQLNNGVEDSYQNFLLKAKEALATIGKDYNVFIEKYIVDNNLIVKNNSLKNIASKTDNIYIYDAPKNSLFNGGIIFPKINEELSSSSLNVAIDSILLNTQKTNQQFIHSLNNYKDKLGILRSKPSFILQQYFKSNEVLNSFDLSEIDRNNIKEVFYKPIKLNKKTIFSLEEGYVLDKEELFLLIENYRTLLPYFTNGVTKKNRKILKKMYKFQVEGINNSFKRKVLTKKSTLADLFYYKTGFPITNRKLNSFVINCLQKKQVEKKGFSKIYLELLRKVGEIEEKLLNNQLEKTKDNNYYIPKKMLL